MSIRKRLNDLGLSYLKNVLSIEIIEEYRAFDHSVAQGRR